MKYPIVIEYVNDDTAIGIHIPDIDGAVTAGDTFEEAYTNAVEVAHLMLEELAKEGKEIPTPSKQSDHLNNPDYKGMGWGMIEIDITPYLGKTEKINVTIPSSLVKDIDDYVKIHGHKSRSSFLTEAALLTISSGR